MSILAQDGYGRGSKLNDGLSRRFIDGVIISPRDIDPNNLAHLVQEVRAIRPDALVLLDPQFYASVTEDQNVRHLVDYPYYRGPLTRSFFLDTRNIEEVIRECLLFQQALPVSHYVTPTVAIRSFDDAWSQAALQMGRLSANAARTLSQDSPVLVSLVFSEGALASRDGLNQYLNLLTELDVSGFYLACERATTSPSNAFEPESLANFLLLVHSLAQLGRYEVFVGFCDTPAVLLHAAGARFCAFGWYNNLKKFSLDRFRFSSGGRRPHPRYFSSRLLSYLPLNPTLQELGHAGLLEQVVGESERTVFANISRQDVQWSLDNAILNAWGSIQNLTTAVTARRSTRLRLDYVQRLLEDAARTYLSVVSRNIVFDSTCDATYLPSWQNALNNFREIVSSVERES
jgi:hypothetical protein